MFYIIRILINQIVKIIFMKKPLHFLIVVVLACTLISSCSKDSDEPAYNNSMTATITTDTTVSYIATSHESFLSGNPAIILKTSDANYNITISFQENFSGMYNFNQQNTLVFVSFQERGSTLMYNNNVISGSLNLIEKDLDEHIMKGAFEFTVTAAASPTGEFIVSNGTFDIKYDVQ